MVIYIGRNPNGDRKPKGDYGTRQTDLAVRRAEWRLSRVYRQAQRDIDEKLKAWQKGHEEREKRYRQQLADGKITQADFDAWMRGQVFQDKQWQARKAEIDRILLNADREAQRIVNEGKIGVFADNANYIGYDLERNGNVNTGFTLYDQNTVGRLIKSDPQILPKPAPGVQKDKAYTYYNKLMNSAITQGIVQGETIPQIAKRIVNTTGERSYSSAVRNARTAYTGAQNAGRMEGLHQAQRLGINVKKKWLATLDSRTRDAHADLDGQIQEVDDPFESELGDIMYPGDPTAEPANVYNCFVGETNIATDSEIIRSYKHDYSGKLITVKTSSGVEFTCTPNHPILTPSGWVAAERLQDRNNLLIASIGEDDPLRINPYIEHAFTRIDAIHQLFDEMGSKRTARLGVNFHGDVPTTDVEIITQKRFLRNNRDSGCADGVNKLLLKHSDESLMGKGAFVQHFGSVWFAALRFVCGFGKALSFFWQSLTHAVIHRFGTVARSNTTVFEPQADSMTGNVQFLGEGLDGFSCKVFIDNIVNINITTVSHIPVYNLQTGNSRYFVNSIIAQNKAKCNGKFAIAHNCRCTLVYVYPEYPSEMQRRDNETGEIVGDMTYREWEQMKRGDGEQPEPEPEIKIPEFEPAKTRAEAEEYAGRFADSVSYNGVSVDNCNAINQQLNELMTKYPINKLNSIEQKRMSAVMSASSNRLNIDGKKLGSVLDGALEDFKKSQEYARQQIEDIKARFAGKAKLPFAVQSTIDKLSEKLKFTRYGVHESYENHVKCTVTHEYGHILSDQYFGMINKDRANPNYKTNWGLAGRSQKWDAAFQQARKTGDIYGISEYANRNSHEFFAECFAAREMGEKLPDYIESLMKETLEDGIM